MRSRTHLFGPAVRVGRKVYVRGTWQRQRESAPPSRRGSPSARGRLRAGTSHNPNPQTHISSHPAGIEQNRMPPPVKHGGEPSIWQKSKSRYFPKLELVSDDVSVSPPAHSEVCLIFIVSFSPPGSRNVILICVKNSSWLEWAPSWEGELGSQ